LSAVVLMCYCVKGRAMLKANALELSDAELARFEERLEKLVKVMEGIMKEIRKIKLEFTITIIAFIAFQILLRWIGF
jgi:predicted secreted protein